MNKNRFLQLDSRECSTDHEGAACTFSFNENNSLLEQVHAVSVDSVSFLNRLFNVVEGYNNKLAIEWIPIDPLAPSLVNVFEVPAGHYDIEELCAAVEEQLLSAFDKDCYCSYVGPVDQPESSHRVQILVDNEHLIWNGYAGWRVVTHLDSTAAYNDLSTAGWLLPESLGMDLDYGMRHAPQFSKVTILGDNALRSDNPPMLNQPTMIFLHSDQLVQEQRSVSSRGRLVNLVQPIPLYVGYGEQNVLLLNQLDTPSLIYKSPSCLNEITISLRYADGRVVDLHGAPFIVNLRLWSDAI